MVSMATFFFPFLFLLPLLFAGGDTLLLQPSARFPAAQAESLIRRLNLLPKDPAPEPDGTDVPAGSAIVERRFGFPDLVEDGVSVDDLGHHAGYYPLPNSHAARWWTSLLFVDFFFCFFCFFESFWLWFGNDWMQCLLNSVCCLIGSVKVGFFICKVLWFVENWWWVRSL